MSLISRARGALAGIPGARAVRQGLRRIERSACMLLAQKRHGVDPHKVFFESFKGRGYNDNPRYVSEKLHELCPEAEIVWGFRADTIDRVDAPEYVRRVVALSREGLREQATARFWVDNFHKVRGLYLNHEAQVYINTWHGDRGFKRVGVDNEKPTNVEDAAMERRCHMMIAGSRFGAENYRTAFRLEGEILMDGCPRNDLLLKNDPAQAADIRRRLGVDAGAGILLYAPTFRDTQNIAHARQDSLLDMPRTLDFLQAHTGRPWVCLCRTHYLSWGMDLADDPRILDGAAWPEMAELLLVTDMLITDYSSCGSDFALLRRPMFLYQPDADEYQDRERSFYFRMEDSPFLIAHTQEELEALILDTDAEKARENGEALDRFFGTTETGRASEAVCRYIMDRMAK